MEESTSEPQGERINCLFSEIERVPSATCSVAVAQLAGRPLCVREALSSNPRRD